MSSPYLLFALATQLAAPAIAVPAPSLELPARQVVAERADTPSKRSLWRREWPEFSWLEGLTTLAAGAGTTGLLLRGSVDEPRWRGGALFDGAVRRRLRGSSERTRDKFGSLGDATYYAAPALALADALLVPLLVHHDSVAARNLTFVSIEAFSYSGLAALLSTSAFARARPDSEQCQGSGCRFDTQSFFSGHSAMAATTAGLICANHVHLGLGGHIAVDVAACSLASANALATATARVVADRHYSTDVLAGLGVGFAIGYAVPTLLHFKRKNPAVVVDLKASGDDVQLVFAGHL